MSRRTQLVRAPKDIVSIWRVKFPKIRDADMIRIIWNTSAVRLESGLRKNKMTALNTDQEIWGY